MHDANTSTNLETDENELKIYDYTHLRRFIGFLAVLIGCITAFLAQGTLSSISASYWSSEAINLISARDFFVGGLCVVSAFLLAYRGRGKWEPLLSKVGCLAAALVAFFPTARDDCATCGSEIHGTAAGVLFVILLVFILGFAKRAERKKRPWRKNFYRGCAFAIGLCLVIGLYAIFALDHDERVASRIIFGVEMGALVAFGVAWLWAGFYEFFDQLFKSEVEED
jgi:hypothetical protein